MISLNRESNPKPMLPPEVRIKSFGEVSEGYSEDMAIREAMRCLQCREHPCMNACPLHMHIPEFIRKTAEGDFDAAADVIRSCSPMPAVCSRVCPQENQCEGHCVRGERGEPVRIGLLERFVIDRCGNGAAENDSKEYDETGKHKVAVIGAGPAGIACAGALADKGYAVTIVEATEQFGGVMLYGIPNYRLPKSILAEEIDKLNAKGVRFVKNTQVGEYFTTDELIRREGYDAVFIGTGADMPTFMKIPGCDASGVCTAHEYLTDINLQHAGLTRPGAQIRLGKRVAVVGAGNVAMDAARCAMRLGAEKVFIIYRRGMEEIPARRDEVAEALEEGVEILLLTNPVEIKTDGSGNVCGVECQKMALGEPDDSGRRQPVPVPDSNFVLDADMVIMALGSKQSARLLNATKGLKGSEKGGIDAAADASTSRPGIYAGGDAVTGPATVSKAVSAGLTAANSIDSFIREKYGE